MITDEEKAVITKLADKYKVQLISVFGSSIASDTYEDIDIAVKGLKPSEFFKFYSELTRALDKQVDIIDLSKESKLNRLVEKEAVQIYG